MTTKEFLSMEETAQLEDQAVCLRDALLIHLLRMTGCRVGEILGIEVSQVNFEARNVSIVHEKHRVRRNCPGCGERIAKRHKLCPNCGLSVIGVVVKSLTDQEFRSLPLDATSIEMIKTYIERGGAKKVGDKLKLFDITRQCAWKVVTDCARKAELPEIMNTRKQRVHHVSPHKLRDAFATNAANRDSSMEGLKRLQEHLGHENLNTTMRYVHTTGTQHREWFDEMTKEGEEENDEQSRD